MLENNTATAEVRDAGRVGAEAGDTVVVQTQFGEMAFSREASLTFPRGLLGFGGYSSFGLANLPDPAYGSFKLMQSLEDVGLAFLVLPIEMLPDQIAADDLNEAYDALEIDRANGAALLIVTVRKSDDKVTLTANLRAPVLIDLQARRAYQHVLANSTYSIRHEL